MFNLKMALIQISFSETCQWAAEVTNCDIDERNEIAVPDFDENKCGGKNSTERMFSCADGACMPKSKFCDRTKDCADGSDENEDNDRHPTNDDKDCDNDDGGQK